MPEITTTRGNNLVHSHLLGNHLEGSNLEDSNSASNNLPENPSNISKNPTKNPAARCRLHNQDCFSHMQIMDVCSIDLILTDPPYSISKETGFKKVKNGVSRFAIETEFGDWDKQMMNLDLMCQYFYGILKKSGTAIIFYDIWKISHLADSMKKAGFKMLRLIIWEKTNPVPLNSTRNYLTNSREVALLGVKHSKPVFNSTYDNGIYKYPIEHTKERFHPTQKPLRLMEDLLLKHSNKGAEVFDAFMGSGTTGVACLKNDRKFSGCELDAKYFNIAQERILRYLPYEF